MWIALFLGGIVVFVLHAVYFSGRVTGSLAVVVPRFGRWRKPARAAYLCVGCSVPVVAILYVVYVAIARPDSFGAPRSRLYDYVIAYPFWLATIWSLQCSLFLLPLDAVHWVLRKRGIATGERWKWRKSAAVLLIAAIFLVYVPVRIAIDRRSLVVRHYDYAVPNLPAALEGYEIALLADIQADPDTSEARQAQLVDVVNRQQPDLVLIAGDIITRDPEDIAIAARQLGRLRARHGVFACVGDHDNFAYFMDHKRSVREVREGLARRGVHMLDNEVRAIEIDSFRMAVIFLTNNYITKVSRERARALIAQAEGSDLRVLLTHQTKPRIVEEARAAGVQLLLAGHTHGGQVRLWLPFVDLAGARFETPYVTGGYRLGDMLLVVSNGLGVSVAPFRYRAPASVDLIRLRAR